MSDSHLPFWIASDLPAQPYAHDVEWQDEFAARKTTGSSLLIP